MKILYVAQSDLERPHGAARHIGPLLRELARLGHEVRLVAPGRLDLPGVTHHVPPVRAPGARLELALGAAAAGLAAMFRPDVAVVRIAPSSLFVPEVLTDLGVPVVLELNGRILAELEANGAHPLRIELVRRALTRAVRRARLLVATTSFVARHAIQELGADRVAVVRNGVDLETAVPRPREAARERLGIPAAQKLAVLVGTLAREVRLDLLAEAHRRLPGLALAVVGDGPEAPRVSAMALAARPSAPVLFLGPRPHAETLEFIAAANVALNLRDGHLGLRGLEYAAMGRRQVLFAVDELEPLIQSFAPETGLFVVRERSPRALAAAIEAALEADAAGPISAATLARVRAELGWDRTAREFVAQLDAAITGGRRSASSAP